MKIADFSAWNIDVNEGREKESEMDEEGIQTAAPVQSWLLEPSVKMIETRDMLRKCLYEISEY